jgi:N-acetylmuramoyl-L-alanine amidase
VLQTAVSLIGYPYVWAGTSERPQAPVGADVPGGFDCSGFVWRVYKLGNYAAGTSLAETLRGRTTYAMSGEVPRRQRLGKAQLEPADVLFFGARGHRSRPAQIDHVAIYLGGGWFIHAGGEGVYLSELAMPKWKSHFAWARRPLAEAGLAP